MTTAMKLQNGGLVVSRELKLSNDVGTLPRGKKSLIIIYLVTLGLFAIPTLLLPTMVGAMFLFR